MALANYTDLQASVKKWLMDRADIVALVPDFIALCEADLNERVRHRSMVKRSTATVTSSRWSLPSDWLEAVNIQVTANNSKWSRLRYASPENIDAVRDEDSTSLIPQYYSIVGSELEFIPAPTSAAVEMIYYAKIPALSDLNTTNWLLTARPDAYLYGSLTHAAPYLEEDERVALWVGARDAAITNLNTADKVARTSGGPLVRRLRTFG